MEALNPLDQQFLLRWFEYHLPYELRSKLMAEQPVLYNKWMGREVMVVMHTDDLAKLKAQAETNNKVEVPLDRVRNYVKTLMSGFRPNKIEAIKMVRYMTDWGLKESKDFVDKIVVEIEKERQEREHEAVKF